MTAPIRQVQTQQLQAKQLQLNLDQEDSPGGFPIRLENRRTSVERVEFAVFPRTAPDQHECTGSTVDRSDSGLSIRSDAPQTAGAVLRVVVRDIDDHCNFDALMRVVWSRQTGEGQYLCGLVMITGGQRRMRMVRRSAFTQQIARSA